MSGTHGELGGSVQEGVDLGPGDLGQPLGRLLPGRLPVPGLHARTGRSSARSRPASLRPIEPGIPDMNPMGCQKGACWSHCHYSPDRVTKPLKRVGERGEGKFEQVSWDEALTDIADAHARRHRGAGAGVDHHPLHAGAGGGARADLLRTSWACRPPTATRSSRTSAPAGTSPGGSTTPSSSMDDWFLAELTLIWHANPVYTNIQWYHYLAESRYNGGEVVTIAPDYSPSAIHADYHLPVRIGTDAALALAMCKVIIDAGLYQKQFVQEQTDLPLLVRKDNGRFLRGSDVVEGEREDQFYWWDALDGDARPRRRAARWPPRASIPRSRAAIRSRSRTSATVEVEPVFARLRRHLEDYTPEKAAEICEIHPDNIRKLARKVATRKTKIFIGWNSGKYYHGDLMERAMALLLGLTGNWGKKGTGTRSWAIMGYDGDAFLARQGGAGPGGGPEAHRRPDRDAPPGRRRRSDHDDRDDPEPDRGAWPAELGGMGFPMPPAFMWYHQYGYKERWNDPENNDPGMKRSFDEYLDEAIEKGWWDPAYAKAYEKVEPRVLFEAGRQHAAAPARRAEAAARAPLAQAQA